MIDNTTRDNMTALLKAWLDGGNSSEQAHTFVTDVLAKKFDISLKVPALDIDKVLYKETGGIPHQCGQTERRIVFGLCQRMLANGFKIYNVDDGEELTVLLNESDPVKAAMELIFNLDEASLRFVPVNSTNPEQDWHGVYLILGENTDIIADWNYDKDDPDGFDKLMNDYTNTL
jgi:hypothetical protein